MLVNGGGSVNRKQGRAGAGPLPAGRLGGRVPAATASRRGRSLEDRVLSIGLIALIDDVVGIAKLAAASLDDATAQATRAGVKTAGIIVDDAAVTPRYVVGFAASRELPIIAKITVGSLRNKLLLLLPAALLLSLFAPWLITPLLMAGGLYLCFEGAEKVIEALGWHQEAAAAHGSTKPGEAHLPTALLGPEEEAERVKGAIRTDFILSAEIMAITLAAVATSPFVTQALVLAIVGLVITLVVYGAVALIVKADDIGLALATRGGPVSGLVGRAIVRAMPTFLRLLSLVGTAAMLWVGGGIILHGFESFGWHTLPDVVHHLALLAATPLGSVGPVVEWLVGAIAAGLFGLVLGGLVATIIGAVRH
jgi:predicted DNA repair protein MutK